MLIVINNNNNKNNIRKWQLVFEFEQEDIILGFFCCFSLKRKQKQKSRSSEARFWFIVHCSLFLLHRHCCDYFGTFFVLFFFFCLKKNQQKFVCLFLNFLYVCLFLKINHHLKIKILISRFKFFKTIKNFYIILKQIIIINYHTSWIRS